MESIGLVSVVQVYSLDYQYTLSMLSFIIEKWIIY